MNDKSSLDEDVYYPEVIPDKTTEFIDELNRQDTIEKIRHKEQDRKDKRLLLKLRHNRIMAYLATGMDEYVHTVDLIIKHAKGAKYSKKIQYSDHGTTFSIPYYDFNFENRNLLDSFLSRLQDEGCFMSFNGTITLYSQGSVYIFRKVDIENLEKFRKIYEIKAKKTFPLVNTLNLTNKDKEEIVKKIINSCNLVGKEAILIKKFGDMDKHTLEELRDATKSKAISQLKSSVKKKIEEIDWTIKEYRGSWDIVSKYQLQKLN